MATDMRIDLPNKLGTLAELGEALREAGVNIGGIACLDAGGDHILVEDPGAARSALEAAGIEVISESEAVVIEIEDRPGTLASVARAAADAGINLEAVYLATATRLVLVAREPAALRSAVG